MDNYLEILNSTFNPDISKKIYSEFLSYKRTDGYKSVISLIHDLSDNYSTTEIENEFDSNLIQSYIKTGLKYINKGLDPISAIKIINED